MQDRSLKDLQITFVGYALSGYVREGVSYMSRGDECREVAIACCDLADACIVELLGRWEKVQDTNK
tara:strand:- start:120 stop:317 length:198 start_codon:yes stop_codon:yes gene_type:complete